MVNRDSKVLALIIAATIIGLIIGTHGLRDLKNIEMVVCMILGIVIGAILQWIICRTLE